MGTETTNKFLWKPEPGDRGADVTTFSGYLDRVDTRLGHVVDVKGFDDGASWRSAYGDYTHDDTEVIQAAIDATVATGDYDKSCVVYFPPGKYLISGRINIPANVTLRGSGQGNTIISIKSDFSTSKSDGYALFAFSENRYFMHYSIVDMGIDMFYGPDDELIGFFWANRGYRSILERVAFNGSIYKDGYSAIVIPAQIYDENLVCTTVAANHNSAQVRDCAFYAFKHPTYGAVYAEGHNDTQWHRWQHNAWGGCSKALVWGGLNSYFYQNAFEVSYGKYVSPGVYLPAQHTLTSGLYPRVEITNGPNWFEGCYVDALNGCWMHVFTGRVAYMPPVDSYNSVKVHVHGLQAGATSVSQIVYFATGVIYAEKIDTREIRLKGSSISLLYDPAYVWIDDGTDMLRYLADAAYYPEGTHNGGNDSAALIHTTMNFSDYGVTAGHFVRNNTDGCWGEIDSITSTTGTNDTANFVSLTGGTGNDFDDGDTYTVYRAIGVHNGGDASWNLVDTTKNFDTLGVEVGMTVYNVTTGEYLSVKEILTTTNPNDTLRVSDSLTMDQDSPFDDDDVYRIWHDAILTLDATADDVPAGDLYVRRENQYPYGKTDFDDAPPFRYITGVAGAWLDRSKLVYRGSDGEYYAADQSDPAKMPAVGITLAVAAESAAIYVGTRFVLKGTGWTPGATLYVSTAGAITTTKPVSGTVQIIGTTRSAEERELNFETIVVL